jgi:hypothetical protein
MKGLCEMSDIISQEHKLEQEEKYKLVEKFFPWLEKNELEDFICHYKIYRDVDKPNDLYFLDDDM